MKYHLLHTFLLYSPAPIKLDEWIIVNNKTQKNAVFDQTQLKAPVILSVQEALFAQSFIDTLNETCQNPTENIIENLQMILYSWLDNKLPFNNQQTHNHWWYNENIASFYFSKYKQFPISANHKIQALLKAKYLVSSNGVYSPQL